MFLRGSWRLINLNLIKNSVILFGDFMKALKFFLRIVRKLLNVDFIKNSRSLFRDFMEAIKRIFYLKNSRKYFVGL